MPPRKKKVRTRRAFGEVRQRASGRWSANYTGPDVAIHRAPATFATEDAAIAWLTEERRKIDLNVWTPPGAKKHRDIGVPLREYCEAWYAATENRHKPKYRALNRGYLDNLILPALGDIAVQALTTEQVRDWYTALGTKYPTRNANAYGLLRTILNQAVDDDEPLIDANPCRVRGGSVKHRVSQPVALTAAQIRDLAAAMPEQWRVLVLVAGFSGLRWGEVSALERRDFQLGEGELAVTVNRAVVRTGGEFIVGRPKSKAALRTVPLPEPLRTEIIAHLSKWSDAGPTGKVFPAKSGDYLNRDTVKEPFKVAATSIGQPHMTIHDLRHSAATLFAQAGMTLADHMTVMGHTSSSMSARYTHSTASRTKQLVETLW